VPKLIIDDAAIQMLMSKLEGQPIYMGPDDGLLKPGIIDLVNDDTKSGRWQPRDRRTSFLVLGAEACKEIVFSSERFDEEEARKRILKNLTVPVFSLMDVVLQLHASLNDHESRSTRSTWSAADQDTFTKTARRLKKAHSRGPVRKIRHTLGAHLDPDIFGDAKQPLRCDDILLAMGNALVLFGLSLNHRARAFSWIREVGSSKEGSRSLVETMVDYPACVRWITDTDGRVVDVAPIVLAADPRLAVQEQIHAAIQSYNSMIRAAGTQLPPISWKAPIKQPKVDDTKELHMNVLLARKTSQ
jgi:hypothetical protein